MILLLIKILKCPNVSSELRWFRISYALSFAPSISAYASIKGNLVYDVSPLYSIYA
jgi:hypothetical protein